MDSLERYIRLYGVPRNLDYREVRDIKPGSPTAEEEKKALEKREGRYIPPPNHPWWKWTPTSTKTAIWNGSNP